MTTVTPVTTVTTATTGLFNKARKGENIQGEETCCGSCVSMTTVLASVPRLMSVLIIGGEPAKGRGVMTREGSEG